ncbi:hypothetical protein LOK85_12715 [Xylella fastidiosa subsp. multiplex]|uniref:hypothetical protein n=1 Tax=Xylella fastidiosa TaxID=2371 RepID=UPI00234C7A0F|nr:hypothetical protein [Xylella fastidiosa]MDC6416732.1 hypothetical protein [Xylella fastidiosa subsp. multiplex]
MRQLRATHPAASKKGSLACGIWLMCGRPKGDPIKRNIGIDPIGVFFLLIGNHKIEMNAVVDALLALSAARLLAVTSADVTLAFMK